MRSAIGDLRSCELLVKVRTIIFDNHDNYIYQQFVKKCLPNETLAKNERIYNLICGDDQDLSEEMNIFFFGKKI